MNIVFFAIKFPTHHVDDVYVSRYEHLALGAAPVCLQLGIGPPVVLPPAVVALVVPGVILFLLLLLLFGASADGAVNSTGRFLRLFWRLLGRCLGCRAAAAAGPWSLLNQVSFI